MVLSFAPTRQELLKALWFPALMGAFLFVFVRYRMLTWDVSDANRRDKVDYSPEAWRLSGYIAALFVLTAYPVMLAKFDAWLWETHRILSVGFVAFWISLCVWLCTRHFVLGALEDERLRKSLGAIACGSSTIPPLVRPKWLAGWGWANGGICVALLIGFVRVASTLR